MTRDPVKGPPSTGQIPGFPPTGKGHAVLVARVIGILCVAAGFVLGIHALDYPGSPMLPTALGMIVTGLLAQVFALVKSCYVRSQGKG